MGGGELTGSVDSAMDGTFAAGVQSVADLELRGRLECRRTGESGCVTLVGLDATGRRFHLSLVGAPPEGLPARLDAASVIRLEGGRYAISAPGGAWDLAVSDAYLHYDLSEAFFRAVPPRRVPLAKRLFWRIILSAAASRVGRRWLAHRRPAGRRDVAPGGELP